MQSETIIKTKREYKKREKKVENDGNNGNVSNELPKKRVYKKKNVISETVNKHYDVNKICKDIESEIIVPEGRLIIDNNIYIEDNNLPKEKCLEIIELFNNDTKYKCPGRIGSGVVTKIKNTTDLLITMRDEYTELDKYLYEKLTKSYKNYLDVMRSLFIDNELSNGWISLFAKCSDFGYQIQEYKKNVGHYKWHSDFLGVDRSETLKQVRLVTFIWYLNDVDEGGKTEFLGGKITPKQGRLLFFPATWTYLHRGEVPISNDKYIITGWIGYPIKNN